MPTLGSEKLFNFPKVTQTPAPPINSKATAFVILPGSPSPHLIIQIRAANNGSHWSYMSH